MKLTDVIQPPDAHSEAFRARYVRLILTAEDEHWLAAASGSLCGYGTSVLGCDAEVGVERYLSPDETPDRRPGVAVLAFHFGLKRVGQAVAKRVGQAVLTCPTAAVFDGLPEAADRAPLGDYLRYFGDGHERRDGDDAWIVPVMEGEVTLPATVGVGFGIAGGVLLVCGRDQAEALCGAKAAADSVRDLPGVITPFPGGVCRSGSKVGSRYQGLVGSTNEAYCPTLKDVVDSRLANNCASVYEVVINGVDGASLRHAMRDALRAAAATEPLAITAPNYGGKLGGIRIPLNDLPNE